MWITETYLSENLTWRWITGYTLEVIPLTTGGTLLSPERFLWEEVGLQNRRTAIVLAADPGVSSSVETPPRWAMTDVASSYRG